ncbi:hypothetical protein [Mesorhizobium caraganae]|uniref:hypothetical protein n=1 Tax=Mesorhizobium caraganae TaxID=483206 RepID=UPI003ECD4050
MTVPKEIRDAIRERLWQTADHLQWDSLTQSEKARHYQQWTDSDIGRTLAAHMDARSVRVYIKDTLLKGFSREKLNLHEGQVLRVLQRHRQDVTESFIKPHGFRFSDGAFVAWGRADDWKSLLGALFERSYGTRGTTLTVFLFRASPRYVRPSTRELVEAAARRLGVATCIWFD